MPEVWILVTARRRLACSLRTPSAALPLPRHVLATLATLCTVGPRCALRSVRRRHRTARSPNRADGFRPAPECWRLLRIRTCEYIRSMVGVSCTSVVPAGGQTWNKDVADSCGTRCAARARAQKIRAIRGGHESSPRAARSFSSHSPTHIPPSALCVLTHARPVSSSRALCSLRLGHPFFDARLLAG